MLVLVVGPSGAGKDTLLGAARAILSADSRIRFVRRTITRPPQPGLEENEAVDAATFQQRRAAGGFALCWEAHGLQYGIPADIGAKLRDGGVAVASVASVSRSVLAEAASRYPVQVIQITAPPEMLACRLIARGRGARHPWRRAWHDRSRCRTGSQCNLSSMTARSMTGRARLPVYCAAMPT